MNRNQYISLLFFIFIHSVVQGQEVIRYGGNNDSVHPDTLIMPEYPGGEEEFFYFLENRLSIGNTRHILNGIGDIVRFTFEVNKTGEIENYKMISSTNPGLIFPFQEAFGMMKNWIPGSKNGNVKKFTMSYILRIRSIPQIPYVEITKEQQVQHKSRTSRSLKWFLGTGAVFILLLLIIVK